jgi:hypothetical protein
MASQSAEKVVPNGVPWNVATRSIKYTLNVVPFSKPRCISARTSSDVGLVGEDAATPVSESKVRTIDAGLSLSGGSITDGVLTSSKIVEVNESTVKAVVIDCITPKIYVFVKSTTS